MSEAKKGRPLSEEHKAALRAASKIRWERGITEENRENIRKARLGKKHSQETIAKLKDSCQKRSQREDWKHNFTESRLKMRKDRVKDKKGYWRVRIPSDHEFASMRMRPNGYVMEHRLVMAAYLGRPLESHEHVHHINKNPGDNRIENLRMMTHSEHMALHHKMRKAEMEYARAMMVR